MDVALSVSLLIVLAPVIALVGLCLSLSVGGPLIFWQQRPGLGGRPFCLYKFRTMGTAHGSDGRRKSDEERVTRVGNFLRRVRLDELPQLFNIIRGDMSFIGPRPLLPCDQDEAYKSRLLVRPGLTGWAQVVGGRSISAQDKAALDIWYLRNASLALDLKIALQTVPMVVFGERISKPLIEAAWQDLQNAGILRHNPDARVDYKRAMA
jgi:lipopolysaccharide/colanic/teichoic acid biosynthesis glycosyltransferase